MKAFALIRMDAGQPAVNFQDTPIHGYALASRVPGTNWGAYLVSGTGPQLLAFDALPQVLGILAFTRTGQHHWGPSMDNTIPQPTLTRLNAWLSNHNQPTIPPTWTYRQLIIAAFTRFNSHFDLDVLDVSEPGG